MRDLKQLSRVCVRYSVTESAKGKIVGVDVGYRTDARTALSNEDTMAWLDQLVEEIGVERLAVLANVG